MEKCRQDSCTTQGKAEASRSLLLVAALDRQAPLSILTMGAVRFSMGAAGTSTGVSLLSLENRRSAGSRNLHELAKDGTLTLEIN